MPVWMKCWCNTGGYMLGFVLAGVVYMLAEKIFGEKLWAKLAALLLGLALCYAFGTAWNKWNLSRMNLKASTGASIEEYADDGEVPEN